MKIPDLGDFKRAVAKSIPARAARAEGPGRQSAWHVAAWPLAVAAGFLVFVTGTSIYLVALSKFNGDLVNMAIQAETRIYALLADTRGAEFSQRGYLLTGDPEYRDTFLVASRAIVPAIVELRRSITDPEQQRTLTELEPLLDRKFAEMAETIRLYDASQIAESLALVRSGVGFSLTLEIREKTIAMQRAERRIFSERAANSAATSGWLLAVNLVGLVLVVGLAAISMLIMYWLAKKKLAYMAALERSNQELDDFAYIASHDLKEPLRGLFNHAAFLFEDYKDKLDDDGVRRLARLGHLCQRMEQLINDLMYFSRLGRAELANEQTDLNAVIADIQQTMDVFLTERHAEIVVAGTLPTLVCDRTRTTEVFRNLIVNAVKYNDSPEPLVEIGFKETADFAHGAERSFFYVKDNGVGIEPEFHQEVFRIFKRLHSANGKESGTGVGLTFVKKIVEHQGGRIWLESELGKGTTFYFTLTSQRSSPAKEIHARGIEPVPAYSVG